LPELQASSGQSLLASQDGSSLISGNSDK